MIDAPELSGSSHSRLDLVGDQKRTVPRAQLTGFGEVVPWGFNRTRFTLYGLHNKRGDRCTDCLRLGQLILERGRVAIRRKSHNQQSSTERLAERGLAHQRERPHRLAMESAQ